MTTLLFKNPILVNEGEQFRSDLLVKDGRIAQIAPSISAPQDAQIIDAEKYYLLPGMIDDQVHFREPGLTHKGEIATESKAALAGGITSYMEMPNVSPPTTTRAALEQKYALAAQNSFANYAFYLGATNDNLDEIKQLGPNAACGIKIFMGSSTGNMLVDDEKALEAIFANCPHLLATHCEDTPTIAQQEALFRAQYGEQVPMHEHASIRSAAACLKSSQSAVKLAQKHGTRLHVLHLSTEEELALFTKATTLAELAKKQITAEACIHHLFFNRDDYARLGSQIKCNPAIKEKSHQQALIQAVLDGVIDVIATDHAPHTWQEKQNSYFSAPSGLPLVQHALQAALEFYHDTVFSLPLIVQKTAHAPALRYQISERGFLREGYFADLVLVDLDNSQLITPDNILYKCGWSPFNGYRFRSRIHMTVLNGQIAFEQGSVSPQRLARRLDFCHSH
ncbi:MAG: dihydroorotase [Vibrionaceae bacterium]